MTRNGLLPAWARIAGIGFAALLALPLVGLLAQVPWAEFWSLVTSASALTALELSVRTALLATLLSVLIGVPVALVLARGGIPDSVLKVVRTLVLLPLVLPPVVGGIALIATYGRRGVVGQLVLPFGIEIGFSTLAVVMAQAFVAMPFLILTLEGALRSRSTELEAIALTLGASPTRALRTVTLPLLWPSLLTGTVLTFARALGEFGATLTFAGSLSGVTRTLPLEIYLQREVDQRAAVAMSILLVVVAAVIVTVAYRAPGGPGSGRVKRAAGDADAGAGAGAGVGVGVGVGAGAGAGTRAGADAARQVGDGEAVVDTALGQPAIVRVGRDDAGVPVAAANDSAGEEPRAADEARLHAAATALGESASSDTAPDGRAPRQTDVSGALAAGSARGEDAASRLHEQSPDRAVPAPALDAHLVVAERDVDVRLRVEPGETLALIGPNGAGKSTIVDALSGLLPIDAGEVRLGDVVLEHPETRRRMPPQRRGIARLGQRPLLFPHLDLRTNVAYGLRSHGVPRAIAREQAEGWLARTDVGGFGKRLPHEVSGGQAQRAAISRALAADPRLCLWDEPFAALDVESAPRQRALLAEHTRDRTAILITHDPADVRVLADRVVVLERGRIVQDAPVDEFLRDPAPGFAAAFVAGAERHAPADAQ